MTPMKNHQPRFRCQTARCKIQHEFPFNIKQCFVQGHLLHTTHSPPPIPTGENLRFNYRYLSPVPLPRRYIPRQTIPEIQSGSRWYTPESNGFCNCDFARKF
ncbi:hypothetical protein CEXT_259141 [Caerostris extrusa]|uniref:Uncharacterized protein n=1 Tax=Caerostris extrusa TaxID=172846 RepID=A0AAV4YAE6_CAEEX|nr:hypothetical protein CEXT_259141 [Caerostris extrusa]